jgi:hypothetical protein
MVERHSRLKMGNVIVGDLRLESIHVEPEIHGGIKLRCVGIAKDIVSIGKIAANVPHSSGEGAARLGLGSIAPEKAGQPLPGLGLIAMED